MDGLKNKETDNAVRIDVEQPDGADIVRDEVWLICAVAKWVVLAIVTGLAVGLVAGGFLLALRWSMDKAAALGRPALASAFSRAFDKLFPCAPACAAVGGPRHRGRSSTLFTTNAAH